uniref:hypothetical protein n=1 Tax=Polaromonas sp. H8N TaxID=1840297 RepID=UPI0015E824CA|nr:hypothetical protein [Polaromonas sp. H8N]
MALVIQIAFGIVLGGFLLMNMDAILGLGMVLLFIVVGLSVLGLAVYLMIDHWAAVTVVGCFIGILVAVWIAIEKINPARGRYLKKRIKEREALGYEATQERAELDELTKKTTLPKSAPMMPKLPTGGSPEKERERRRLLGYDN